MASNADYFGDAAAPEELHRHRSRTRKHRSSKHHRDDSDSSDTPVEEVVQERLYRDPVTGSRIKETNKTEYVKPSSGSSRRRHRRRSPSDSSDDDDDEVVAAAAAVPASSTRSGGRRHRSSRRSKYDDEYDAPPQPAYPGDASVSSFDQESGYISRSPSPRERRRERRKSVGETALASLGLGAVAEKVVEKKDDLKDSVVAAARSKSRHGGDRDRHRSSRRHGDDRSSRRHSKYDSSDESDSGSEREGSSRKKNSLQAAVLAAAVEAYRARKEPGGLMGEKGLRRVVEAAVASGALESVLGRKGEGDRHSTRHIMESVIGGLGAQRALNGSRSKSRGGSNPLVELIASGAIAAGGKKLLDSRERARSASRSRHSSSRSSRPSMGRQRSHSAGDILSAVGLGGAAEVAKREYDKHKYGGDRDRHRHRGGSHYDSDEDYDDRRRSRRSRGVADEGAVVAAYPAAAAIDPNNQQEASTRSNRRSSRRGSVGKQSDDKKHKWKGSDSSSSGDDLSDMDSETERKKVHQLQRSQFLGVALAVIGSLHAAATIYEGKQKRAERKKKLASGKIGEGEAAKMRAKHQLRDVTSVGLAVLGASEAYKSWKESYENRKELRDFNRKCEEHHKRKLLKESGNKVQQAIMPGSVAAPHVDSAGTYPAATYATDAYPADTYPYTAANGVTSPRVAYTTKDGRAVPVVYPSSVRDA